MLGYPLHTICLYINRCIYVTLQTDSPIYHTHKLAINTQLKLLQHYLQYGKKHCSGANNDGDTTIIIYIGHTSKFGKLLLTVSLVSTNAVNYAMTLILAMMQMPWLHQ